MTWRDLDDGTLLQRSQVGEQVVDLCADADVGTALISSSSRFQLWDLREGGAAPSGQPGSWPATEDALRGKVQDVVRGVLKKLTP